MLRLYTNKCQCYGISKILFSKFSSTTKTLCKARLNSTVDLGDVQRFSKQSDLWWNPTGPMRVLHRLNAVRIPFVRDGLVSSSSIEGASDQPLKNKKILDVGCGCGLLSEPLARLGANVTGIDAGEDVIGMARHADQDETIREQLTYMCTPIEEHFKEHRNSYDGIVASEIIEHVDNKELFIKSCVEVLKPGGRIFLTTPNRTLTSQFYLIYLAEYVLKLIPKGTHQIEKFTNPEELTKLLERNNCKVELIQGIIYRYFYKRFELSDSKSQFFALQAVKK